jgi:hypothetical protein
MPKPCDTKEFRDRLPCLAPGDDLCFGRVCWERKRGTEPGKVRYMAECPRVEQVRGYWRRKWYGK